MTVLVGYLPTVEGEAAFAAALDEAVRRAEPLLLINSPRSGAPVSADAAAPAELATLTKRASEAGVALEIRQPSHTGELSEALLAAADEADASVIVIGLRRRSPVGKLFLGSAAQQILLNATRPVLAVKPAHH
ncbi:universal stress protein [Actinoplanes italicus]|uniref:Nucleotide-binding universal stress UspA family protein n=1 Tax=Actinoplanes italicus TaxID=113567 RepID=A0A2T0KA51_9ACTN|nr:universal stress protein [Actinoplanes italicus]PRX20011.1 nucleotide-binding universal stress UspA family protein [Actinoplanes italicus]GIE31865.1 universal stress protein [Actinoplanes italicus]